MFFRAPTSDSSADLTPRPPRRPLGDFSHSPKPSIAPRRHAPDPRRVLAARTTECLQGSILPPEQRAKLLRLGKVMGLSTFDASLIIAVVQDRARRGHACASIPQAAVDSLTPLPPSGKPARSLRRRILTIALPTALLLAVELLGLALWLR